MNNLDSDYRSPFANEAYDVNSPEYHHVDPVQAEIYAEDAASPEGMLFAAEAENRRRQLHNIWQDEQASKVPNADHMKLTREKIASNLIAWLRRKK